MRPSRRLLWILGAWFALGALCFALRLDEFDTRFSDAQATQFAGFWSWCGIVLIVLSAIDALRTRARGLELRREIPEKLALDTSSQIRLTVVNRSHHQLHAEIFDHFPAQLQADHAGIRLTIDAHTELALSYSARALVRGPAQFGFCEVWLETPLRLWQQRLWLAEPKTARIFPNFVPVLQSASVSLEHQLSQIGAHLQQRRGEGSSFRQLREFREGDALRQIDWSATARTRKPISREYQEEKDQDLIFLLDCGRRLRAKDEHISHFDHALNALLLTAHIAHRQGDGVGLLSFAGQTRWLAPQRSEKSLGHLLNHLYDLDSSTETSDYLLAVEQLNDRRQKRALIILITHPQAEDLDELNAAVALLKNRHLLMIASIRDRETERALTHPVAHFSDALVYCSALQAERQREHMLGALKARGAIIVEALPQHLHSALVNEYISLKRSGRF